LPWPATLMTICREWLLHRRQPGYAEAKPLTCRSWNCDYCQPQRKRQMLAQAASGAPLRFVTLTVNPKYLDSPEARLKALAWAWRTVVKRLRREHPNKEVEYFAVVEATLKGEPHLHILFRGPFIPQAQLSAWMDELIHAFRVDVRRIKNVDQAVRYVAKYITKKPAQFGTSKRYWQSQGYQLQKEGTEWVKPVDSIKWEVFRGNITELAMLWINQGLAPRRGDGDSWLAVPIGQIGKEQPPWNSDSQTSLPYTTGKHTKSSASTPMRSQPSFL